MKWFFTPYYLVDEYLLILKNRIKYSHNPLPPKQWLTGTKGDIVLVQGLTEGWVYLQTIGNTLNKLGFRIRVINDLKTNLKPIGEGVEDVKKYILKHDLKNVILVTHSKGGLIALTLSKDPQISKRIKKIVCIACSFNGSVLAKIFPALKELFPNSTAVRNATSGVDVKKIISLYPQFDNHVVPHESLILKGADNRLIDVWGHTRILESPATLKEILAKLS